MITRRKLTVRTLVPAVLAAGGLIAVLSACGPATTVKPAPKPATSSAAPSVPNIPVTPSAAPSTPAPVTSGPVGTTFTVSGNDDNNQPMSYDTTLNQIDQHAQLGQYESVTTSGDHVAAAQFKLTGDTGVASDDVNNDTVAIGSDGQDYQPAFDTLAEGTNFNDGNFNLRAGQSVTGWVTFELPAGVTVSQIQWQADPFGDSTPATWDI